MAPLALWLLLVSLGRGWAEAGVGGVPTFRLGNDTPGNVKATMPRTNIESLVVAATSTSASRAPNYSS